MPWPCCCGSQTIDCANFSNSNCCLNPYANYEYVILICNVNAAKDDEFDVTLNGTLLGPITELGLNQCGGRFFATSEAAISKVKALASTCNNSFNDCCMQNTFNFTLFSKELINIAQPGFFADNRISMYNTKNNNSGNFGRIIVFRVMNNKRVAVVYNGNYSGPSGSNFVNVANFGFQEYCQPSGKYVVENINSGYDFGNSYFGKQLYPEPLGYFTLFPIRCIIEPVGEIIDPVITGIPVVTNLYKNTLILNKANSYGYGFAFYEDYTINGIIQYSQRLISGILFRGLPFNLNPDFDRNEISLITSYELQTNILSSYFYITSGYYYYSQGETPFIPADINISYDENDNLLLTLTGLFTLYYYYPDPVVNGNFLRTPVGQVRITHLYKGTPISC